MNPKQLSAYQHLVGDKYHQYAKLFLELPFPNIPEAGKLLPEFAQACIDGLANQASPIEIVETFFANKTKRQQFEQQIELMLVFLQFIERQILLFDALEDSAFSLIQKSQPSSDTIAANLDEQRKQHYHTRIVLTAHPTQFYPPEVLSIMHELTIAIKQENIEKIKLLLLQLGKTAFQHHQQPSPLDEATHLITLLKRVFYPSITELNQFASQKIGLKPNCIQLGFWPGADRDGNPNVTADITLRVANQLKHAVLQCYLHECKQLSKRITFKGTVKLVRDLKQRLINTLQPNPNHAFQNPTECIDALKKIRDEVQQQHEGLFADQVNHFISAIQSFGFHFASLDLRQNSPIHSELIDHVLQQNYLTLSSEQKVQCILQQLELDTPELTDLNSLHTDVIASIKLIPHIQNNNGIAALQRYIISNTQGAYHVLEILLLAKWSGLNIQTLQLDIVPLFESVADLQHAAQIMDTLFQLPLYQQHLGKRKQQTVMLGFSDGTKDGGYFMANWAIMQAKRAISDVAKKHNVEIIFFDGRGGPPARGGGKTHEFYRAQDPSLTQQIQLTVQGQTIHSNFGTVEKATYNTSQLFSAGIEQHAANPHSSEDNQILQQLAELSYQHYQQLKTHPNFIAYLTQATPLPFFGELNIASRPPTRDSDKAFCFEDLRAIPFVGSWSQMKQNVPGYYGVGFALKKLIDQGKLTKLQQLYQSSLFFNTLLNNAMQSLKKSNLGITQYLEHDQEFGEFWQLLRNETELSSQMILAVTQQKTLLENDPIVAHSIELREEIVLPLLIIQQYALQQLRQDHSNTTAKASLHKLILKSISTNINASRNSA